MFAPGTVIAQKYWVERVLGQGGMGVVVAATHLQLGQRFALKFLRAEPAPDAEAVERFLREARAAVRLRSEHVCRVIDVGTIDAGTPYIVMEHLDGHDLATVLKQGGALPIARAVDYVVQACLALAEAHVAGMVHRDLKPANLFLTRRPEGTPLVKVMDFGIAKAHGRMDARLTDSAAMMGSPSYMAPEQLKSARHVDARADIWSLGVVLYELVTRTRPFDAESVAEIAAKVAVDPPAPLPPYLPGGFADVIMRCLQKDRTRRFADVGELARALAPFGSPSTTALATATTDILSTAATTKPRTDPLARIMGAETRPRWKSLFAREVVARRRLRVVAVAAVAVAALLAAALIYVLTRSPGNAAAPAATVPVDAAPAASAAPPVDASIVVMPLDPAPPTLAIPLDAGAAAPNTMRAPPVDAPRARRGGSTSTPPTPPPAVAPPPIDAGTVPLGPTHDHTDLDLDGDGIPDHRGL